jgi:hypothetical protein
VLRRLTLLNQGAGQTPRFLANTTMETYLMAPDNEPGDNHPRTSSCMACHSLAGIGRPDPVTRKRKSADFSYLLQEAFPAAANTKLSDERRQELSRAFSIDTSKGGQPTKATPRNQ